VRRLSVVLLVVVLPLLAACRSDGSKPLVATADSVSATSTTTKPPAPTTTSAPTTPPLFTYREDPQSFAFWSSGALRVVHGGVACDGALDEGGNMWTRSDVLAALADPDVKAALARKAGFASAYPEQGELVAAEGKIEWWNSWDKPPPPEPKAVHHLHEVLHVVLENRASLCK
jgi:hypothetical protein